MLTTVGAANIEDIRTGEYVYAKDEETGQQKYMLVLETYAREVFVHNCKTASMADDAAKAVIKGGSDVIQSKFNKLLNSDYYKTDFGYDCSEIAQDFYDVAGQQGKIYRIEGKEDI